MNIQKQNTAQQVAQAAGENISALLAMYAGQKVHLLLSGGSAFSVLEHVDMENVSPQVSVYSIDDRYDVSEGDQNYHALSQTSFAKNFVERGGKLCDMNIAEASSLEDARDAMQDSFQRIADSEGVVIALLGIGSDGHTVGMMPYPEDKAFFDTHFVSPEVLVTAYNAREKNSFPLRVTATGTFLQNHVDHAVVFAVGEGKRDALVAIHEQDSDMHVVPARIVHHMKDVTIYTDQSIEESAC